MPRSTKGQVQMVETVAVIIVFIVIVVFGLVWWVQASQVNVQLQQDEVTRLELVEMTKEIMNMPELQCSVGGQADSSCVDAYRARALRNLIDGSDPAIQQAYEDNFFGYSLRMETLFPEDGPMGASFVIFDFEPPNSTGSMQAAVPVVVWDPITDRSHFAMLILTQHLRGGVLA